MSSTLFCPNFSVNLRSYTICQCYPESWARYIHTQSEENQVSTYNTTTLQHSKMSSLSPTNPASGNFCRSAYWQVQRLHIQHHCFNFLWWSVEDLKAKWELIMERSRHKQALLTLQLHFWSLFINCCFNHKLFHWACMKNFCLHSLMKFVQKWDFEQLCISQIETSTSLPPPGEHTPGMWHPHRPGRREFDYQSPPGGGEFELHAQFHVKSLAWRALIGTVVLEDFRGKDCAFEANWLRVLCRIWRYLNFNIFNIGFRLWINECNKLCV